MTQQDKNPNSDDDSQPKPSEPHQVPDKRTQTPTEKPAPEDGEYW